MRYAVLIPRIVLGLVDGTGPAASATRGRNVRFTMQTKRFEISEGSLPRLEYCSQAGEAPDCSLLRSFPFTIGRAESADLQVASSRVSREHAVIVREQDRFRLRDLKSTNGTFLNGEPIQEAWLSDGDILTIADTELTFYTGDDQPTASMATQVMQNLERSAERPRAARGQIIGVRRLHEPSVHVALAGRSRRIVTLHDDATFGWSMDSATHELAALLGESAAILTESSAPLAVRLRQLARINALDEFATRQPDGRFLFGIRPVELEDFAQLKSHLERLRDGVSASASLAAVLPSTTTYAAAQTAALQSLLDELDMRLAWEAPVSDCRQLLESASARPAYAILTARTFREVSAHRPARKQLTAVLAALEGKGCRPIADERSGDVNADALGELGFRLALRDTGHRDLISLTSVASDVCSTPVGDEPTDTVQSTLAEIAKVTARIRASWSNR